MRSKRSRVSVHAHSIPGESPSTTTQTTPSSNLAAYLAKNYLTASGAPSHPDGPPNKKRKKSKHGSSAASTGLLIADDDEDLSLSGGRNGANEDDEADIPMMFEGKTRSAEFRKAKKSAWQSLSISNEPTHTTTGDDDDADAFLRTAQSDEARRLAEQDAENAPAVVDMPTADTDGPRTETGLRAGLQTAADTARLIAEEEAREEEDSRKALRKSKKKKTIADNEDGVVPPEEETIYRDATGRRIDVSLRRAEARREEAEKARAKQQEKIDAMGEVQKREMEERRKELDEAKFLKFDRTVEDEEYNDRLKDVVRWDDPMAAYMAEKRAEEGGDVGGIEATTEGAAGGGAGGGAVRKKGYFGHAPPNRYGIKPGSRWDGVDRGNGFEKEWFQARSRRSRNDQLSYEWQMDE